MAKLDVVPEFEAPWVEILQRLAKNNQTMRALMENYVGSQVFRDWLDEKVLD